MVVPESLLEVEPLDLGADVKAVGLELIDPGNREPVRGAAAAGIWSAVVPALAAEEPWALDFFSHLDRLREFCSHRGIPWRDAANRCVVVSSASAESLAALFERFEGETFGVRAGGPLADGDTSLENDLARRGVDAYHPVFGNYFFCAVCDFKNGYLTLLTHRIWASEAIRRLRSPLELLSVSVVRPGP